MSDLRFYLGLFATYVSQYAKTRLQYRGDLITGLASDLVSQGITIIFLTVIFGQIPDLNGWSRAEVFFIYGFFLWPHSFFSALSDGLWDFTERYILRGELDRLLLRPAHSLFQLILEGLSLEPLFGLLTGSAIMIWAGRTLALDWRWYDPLLLLILTVGSTLIYFGVYLPLAAISFWYDGRTGILNLTWNVNTYGRYPVTIYRGILRILLTWVFPFAFVGFFPAAYFLRRGAFLAWAALTPALGLLFFSLALWIWKAGLRRYHSTGS